MLARCVSIVILCLLFIGPAMADTRLGGPISDFRSRWGPPFQEQVLTRTATLKWNRLPSGDRLVVPDIFGAEVGFLDGRACKIVLRSRRNASANYLFRLVKPFVESFKASKMPEPKSNFTDAAVYELNGHTIVLVNKFPGRDVIIIMGRFFSKNQDIFDREAAMIRRPTPNH
jgi:hypothetical protein